MSKLSLVIPLMENEVGSFLGRYELICKRLSLLRNTQSRIDIVLQKSGGEAGESIKEFSEEKNVFVWETDIFSVSHARNLGLEMVNGVVDYVLFLDNDAMPSSEFLAFLDEQMRFRDPMISGRLVFGESNGIGVSGISNAERSTISCSTIIHSSFLGIYAIRVDVIGSVRFRRNLGPGVGNKILNGEDLLFLFEVLKSCKIRKMRHSANCVVEHPKRLPDNLKRLSYARGDAVVMKHIVFSYHDRHDLRFAAILRLLLFLGNGAFLFASGRPNGAKVFFRRVYATIFYWRIA